MDSKKIEIPILYRDKSGNWKKRETEFKKRTDCIEGEWKLAETGCEPSYFINRRPAFLNGKGELELTDESKKEIGTGKWVDVSEKLKGVKDLFPDSETVGTVIREKEPRDLSKKSLKQLQDEVKALGFDSPDIVSTHKIFTDKFNELLASISNLIEQITTDRLGNEIDLHNPPKDADPIRCIGGEWYFFDENFKDLKGPFKTLAECELQLVKYSDQLLKSTD